MAIKVGGTEVVSNTRELKNIASIDAGTLSVLNSGISTEATRGTLTKSFTSGETASITLSAAVSPAPVVSATKEVPQAGIVSKGAWDVSSTGTNYDRLNSAYNTTLTPSAEGWDVPLASFNQSLNMTTAPFLNAAGGEEAYPTGLYIRSDGLKMYVTGFAEDSINEFNLSTAWDVSSASHVTRLSIGGSGSGQDDRPEDVFFKPDGTKLYFVGNDGNDVNEYNLSTAWDLSTASFNQTESVNTQESNPGGIFFKPDGLKMYIVGKSSDKVHEYNLSTAWDISTKSFLQSLSFYLVEGSAASVFFKPDGLKMYITGKDYDYVYTYTLTTAWDISTVYQYSTGSDNAYTTFSVTSKESFPEFLFFSPDGLKMYVGGTGSYSIHEYNLPVSNNLLTLGTGSFASGDIGKTIVGNNGVAVLTAADGSYVATTAFTDSSTIAAGSWSMNAVAINATDGLEMSNGITGAWDVSQAVYLQNFSFTNQDQVPTGISFKTDGTKMYMCGTQGDDVNEYNLSTAWDVSTAVYSQAFSTANQVSNPEGLYISPDGTKMYAGRSNNIFEYTLSTAWDVSTSTYIRNISVSSYETDLKALFFSYDGTKLYFTGHSADAVIEYALSTAWDISTGTYTRSFSLTSQSDPVTYPQGLYFSPDGLKMYVVDYYNDDVHEYNLSTAWNVSTASHNYDFYYATGNMVAVYFKPDGAKMYVVEATNFSVYEFNVGTVISSTGYAPSITNSGGQIDSEFWTDINSMTTDDIAGAGAVHYAVSTDNHTTWSVIKEGTGVRPIARNNSGTWQYNSAISIANAWSVVHAVYSTNYVITQDTSVRSAFFKPDGTKMYVGGMQTNYIYEYNLGTAWDVSTSVYSTNNKDISAQVTNQGGLFFKPDGTKMYMALNGGTAPLNEYNLGTAWDVSTAVYSQNKSLSSQTPNPQGIFFRADGLKLYVIGTYHNRLYEYTLSTAWDVSTFTFVQYKDVSGSGTGQDTNPVGLFFKDDGLKVYFAGETQRFINEYTLSTAWDISTASYTQRFDFSSQEIYPKALSFKPDGSKMVLLGEQGNDVNEYNVGTQSYTTSTTWANSTTNSELYALQQALTDVSINRMDKAQLEAVTDPNHYTLGNSLDLMISLYLASASSNAPSSDGVSINYDAATINQGAVLGTDYNYDFPNSTTVRVTSSAAQNLKVRVV